MRRAGGTTTLPIFALSRFCTCYCSPRDFSLKVSPFALKGIRSQPFPAMQVFNLPLDGARAYVFNSNLTDRLVWSSMACKQASAFRQGFLTVLLPFFSPVWEWVPGHRSHVTFFKVACALRAPTVCSGLPDRPFCFHQRGPVAGRTLFHV